MRFAIAALGFVPVLVAGRLADTNASAAAATDAPASLAEPPYWPVGMKLPPSLTANWKPASRRDASKAEVLVWTPPEAKRIRAVLLIPNNTDSKHVGEHAALRKVAAKRELGVVYLRRFDGKVIERSDPPVDAKTLLAVLGAVAERTGIVEFRYAPWITFGKSSRGRFPFRTTWWFPKRVIASISYHGETPTWPMESWSRVRDESVLHLAINGQHEWSGTWYRHVRPCMLNYHANTSWLTHQVVLHGVGHGNYADVHGGKGWGKPVPEGRISCLRVWDYVALYIDKAMALRVPKAPYPTTRTIRLKQVDRDSGYLIHPRAPEELLGMKWHAFRYKDGTYRTVPWPDEKHPVLDPNPGEVKRKLWIRRAADVPEAERKKMFWVPDRELAEAWLKLHNVRKLEGVLPRVEPGAGPG
jgi:hypothetical protein